MKTKIVSWITAFVWLFDAPAAFSQYTAFTYQGRVTDNDTNFTGLGQFKFALVTPTNASVSATAVAAINAAGGVTSYFVASGGSGYVTAPSVKVYGADGSGATATAHLAGGLDYVKTITVDNPGSGYTYAPKVELSEPPANLAYSTAWSNDGTGTDGSEPATAVGVDVVNGLFTVVLGDTMITNMTAISASLFAQPNLQLRIWFNDGVNGSMALNPVQSLTSAPYAAFALASSNFSGMLPAAQLTGTLPGALLSGSYTSAVVLNNAANSISGNGSGLTSLNASQLALGTVPLAQLSGITSSQLDATTWQLATNLNGGNAALASNVVSGISITDAFITNSIFSGNGAGLTNLNASQLAGGTLPDARLSGNVTMMGSSPVFSNLTVTNALNLPKFSVSVPLTYSGCFFPRSGSFISHGGTVLLFCTASCYASTAGYHGVLVSVDSTVRGSMVMFFNLTNTHMSLPGNTMIISGLAAGSHIVTINSYDAYSLTDCNDNNEVVALELPF